MSGEQIKKILKEEGVGLCGLAKRMGYAREQNLYSVLSIGDVRSSVIESIAQNIGKPVSWFYGEDNASQGVNSVPDTGISVSGDNNTIATISERFIGLLEEKDKQINRLLAILEKS